VVSEEDAFRHDLTPTRRKLLEEIAADFANSAREALAIALTGMMQDGQISRERALEWPHMLLHDTRQALWTALTLSKT